MTGGDGLDRAVLDRIDATVERAVQRGEAPGVVAAVARGEQVHVATAGCMAVHGLPIQRDTLFRISSTTKPVTAAAALSMVDDGAVDLDASVEGLLPEVARRRVLTRPDAPLDDTVTAERPITVRDLLTFTWGFGMQGAMFMASQPWPIVAAAEERQLHTFGPPQPDSMPDPDTWMARLSEPKWTDRPSSIWPAQPRAKETCRPNRSTPPKISGWPAPTRPSPQRTPPPGNESTPPRKYFRKPKNNCEPPKPATTPTNNGR